LIIAVLIRIFDGPPVFFLQERLGQHGRIFKIIKFRTMIPNAEKIGKKIFIEENDPRITKIGAFLRKTSLDEIPQFINILKGDMSLVGPRPPLPTFPYAYENYPEKLKKRFTIKPGVTGLAQVVYRNSVEWEKRFELDLKYVDSMSFLLDMKILLSTIFRVVKPHAIYGKGNRERIYSNKENNK
jgi:lipopolysaccharide/colanic/teichoic acid biosynthesis glycosyltransferase